MEAIFRLSAAKQNLRFLMVTITWSNSCAACRLRHTRSQRKQM